MSCESRGLYSVARRRAGIGSDSAMWSVVLAAVLGLAAGAMPPGMEPEMLELAAMLRQSCVEASGVAEGLLAGVDGGGDLPPDGQFKCYLKCTMESAGMLTDGAVSVEAVLAPLPAAVAAAHEPFLRACGTQPGADHCEVAYNTQKCWRAANPKEFFII